MDADRTRPRPAPGRGVQATWTYTLGSIVFIFVALDAVLLLATLAGFSITRSPVDAILVALILVSGALHVRYTWFLRVGLRGGLPRTVWTVALVVPAALTALVGLAAPGAALISGVPLWIAVNLVAALVDKRPRNLLIAAGAVVVAAHGAVVTATEGSLPPSETPGFWMLLVYSVLLPPILLSSLWWWDVVRTLDRHRSMAGELAVAQERLRFASDLHDIQGHHLQVIALKTELAERMLSVDVEAAREHVHASRLIAKQALEETRSLIAGYREVDLEQELENAREVLTAAGAACSLDVAELPRDPEAQRTLALVVREATTNILRHSGATKASIRIAPSDDGSSLVVSNNVLADSATPGQAASTGLDGLRARLAALGGTLDVEADAAADLFELRAWVPARAEVTT
ncbi:sensor histidine kinase [Marisediminicola sp. LYQ134]|uniref:sensor histidine kinase n=1 Tax=unclassified Marisediminicola TaxID=2618316 RepID=UPI003983CC74